MKDSTQLQRRVPEQKHSSARMSFMESSSTTFSRKQCIVKLTLWVHLNRRQLRLMICHKTRFRLVYNNKQASECTPVLLHNITSSESLAAGCTKKKQGGIYCCVSCDSNVRVNLDFQPTLMSVIEARLFKHNTQCHLRLLWVPWTQSVCVITNSLNHMQVLTKNKVCLQLRWTFSHFDTINALLVERWLKNTRQVKQASSLSIQSHMKSESILIMFKFSILNNLSSTILELLVAYKLINSYL